MTLSRRATSPFRSYSFSPTIPYYILIPSHLFFFSSHLLLKGLQYGGSEVTQFLYIWSLYKQKRMTIVWIFIKKSNEDIPSEVLMTR